MVRLGKLFKAVYILSHIQVFEFLLLAAFVLLLNHYNTLRNALKAPPPVDTCFLIGTNPTAKDLWQFSARSLCLTSDVCFNPGNPDVSLYHASDLSKTSCHIYDPDFKPASIKFPSVARLNFTEQTCQSFQHQFVHCAHGTGLVRALPVCPNVQKLSFGVGNSARWLEHISIVVPDYAFSKNIYHYLNPIADLARTVDNLPTLLQRAHEYRINERSFYSSPGGAATKKINIIFQGPRYVPLSHKWKQELLELIITQRMLKKGIDVNLYFAEDFKKNNSHVCLRDAVLLGRRGHFNVWPFPNRTEVPLHGFSVPLDAVSFKQAVYDGVGINARLPRFVETQEGRSLSEPPPFTVGYAKREGRPGSDGYYRGGTMRRFFEEDEEWFTDMLRNETEDFGADLITIPAKMRESLKEQVRDIVRVGFVIGIHGANLVNAMFMHPFGVLMEIVPKNATEECYIGGANSGLKYLRAESSEQVSLLDSGCHPRNYLCKVDPRKRAVSIRLVEDRERIRRMVRQGLEHLRFIRTRFPDGIPVKYNSYSMYYDVEV